MTFPLAPDLGAAITRLAAGKIDAAAFTTEFMDRTLYAVRLPGRPRLAAYQVDDALWAPVFSTLAELARWCAGRPEPDDSSTGVDWYALTGNDLMTHWPAGCGLVVDPGSPHSVCYPAEGRHPEAASAARTDSRA